MIELHLVNIKHDITYLLSNPLNKTIKSLKFRLNISVSSMLKKKKGKKIDFIQMYE